MIADNLALIKQTKENIQKYLDWLITFAVIGAVAIASFGLGRISVLNEKIPQLKPLPLAVQSDLNANESTTSTIANTSGQSSGQTQSIGNPNGPHNFVASKNGTKYYPVGCAWANRIKDANKVWFASTKEAEAAGYQRTQRCK